MSGAGSQQGPESIEKLRLLQSEYEILKLREDDPIRKDELEERLARVKELIAERLGHIETQSTYGSGTKVAAPSELFLGDVNRTELFESLLELARMRDIVFAIGGVGSGLRRLHQDFFQYVTKKLAQKPFEGVDFDLGKFESFLKLRNEMGDFFRANDATYLGLDQLELKCLLTSLAHSAYMALRDRGFNQKLDRLLRPMCVDPVHFINHYFGSSQCMMEGEAGSIVDYFFSTLQKFAEVTETESVLIFMPWLELANCFQSPDIAIRRLGNQLWKALGNLATSQSSTKHDPPPVSKYNKVCLIVASRYVPYGKNASIPNVVTWWVWPVPSFTVEESRTLLNSISPDFESRECSEKLMEYTDGTPWLTRYALSYVKYVHQVKAQNPLEVIQQACNLACKHMPERLDSPVNSFAHSYIARIRATLERGVMMTDPLLVDAWVGRTRKSGIQSNERVESFVASGLVWLKGNIWNNATSDFVFDRFPRVYFREPGKLARIAYEVATGRKLPMVAW